VSAAPATVPPMRYLVTGAAGFIGSHLYEALQDRGDAVVGLDCFTDYYDVGLKEENARGKEIRRIDLARDPIDLDGIDGIFHLAGQPGVRSFGDVFETYLDRNVLASQRLFEAAARDGVRVVFASSSSIYGDAEEYPTAETVAPRPVSPYGITKLSCEHLARATARSFGLDVVVTRYFNAYGPRQRPDMAFTRIAMALAEGRPFDLFGDGLQSRSFTYVGDVVRGTIAAMEAGSGTYNVGGGEEATMRETIALFEELSGCSLDVREHPSVPGDQRRTKADTTRIRDDLGWAPTTPLGEGVKAHWEWAAARVAAR
jgi:UDP-glucuronate 4-epimerase